MAKFSKGEIAEAKDGDDVWFTCSIVSVLSKGMYEIDVPGVPPPPPDRYWLQEERYLRKRRPPTTYRDQHEAADKDFQDSLRRALGQSEKVT